MKAKKRGSQSGTKKVVRGERTARADREPHAAPEKKRASARKKPGGERRATMATSDESKSGELGNISQEVEREAKGISSWSAAPGASGEGASASASANAAPQGGVDSVMSAIMAMSDLGDRRRAPEETAASAESAVQSALAMSGRTDGDTAKLAGVRSE